MSDWHEKAHNLLQVVSHARGLPQLKAIHDHAMADLEALAKMLERQPLTRSVEPKDEEEEHDHVS